MTRPYSLAFRQKMLVRLTGRDAVSAQQLSAETGVRQQNLSRWLQEARSLPAVGADDAKSREWCEPASKVDQGAASNRDQLLAAQALDPIGIQLFQPGHGSMPIPTKTGGADRTLDWFRLHIRGSRGIPWDCANRVRF
jgi:hypothetical protein